MNPETFIIDGYLIEIEEISDGWVAIYRESNLSLIANGKDKDETIKTLIQSIKDYYN
jgi:hypothetical protein